MTLFSVASKLVGICLLVAWAAVKFFQGGRGEGGGGEWKSDVGCWGGDQFS